MAACEQAINPKLPNFEKTYSVDGTLSNQPGPYTVKITLTAKYSVDAAGLNYPVENATVTISDDSDNTVILTPSAPGQYQSPADFTGIVGRKYILAITTANNDQIMSIPELLSPVPEIKDYRIDKDYSSDKFLVGHKVSVLFDDPSGTTNYYRWKWEGVYQFVTQINHPPFSTTCWRYEHPNAYLNTIDDKYFDGQEKTQEITEIPYFGGNDYLVTVYQESLTEDAYNYWELVYRQLYNSGSIFEPPPASIKGNLYCANDPTQLILGFFTVSAISEMHIKIHRTNDGAVKNLRSYPRNVNCWTLANSVQVQPDPSTWPEGW